MNGVLERLELLDHHLEHEFAGISDHIDTVTAKLKKREDSADIRIENLEDEIKKVNIFFTKILHFDYSSFILLASRRINRRPFDKT